MHLFNFFAVFHRHNLFISNTVSYLLMEMEWFFVVAYLGILCIADEFMHHSLPMVSIFQSVFFFSPNIAYQ